MQKGSNKICERTKRQKSRHRAKAKAETGVPCLNRLGAKFPFSLHLLMLDELSHHVSDSSILAKIRDVIAKHDYDELRQLKDAWSLSEMASLGLPACEFACIRQAVSLLEKFQVDEDRAKLHSEAIRRFEQTDDSLNGLIDQVSPAEAARIRRWVTLICGPCPSSEQLCTISRHGPGSSSSHPYMRRFEAFKFLDLPYAVSTGALGFLEEAISSDPNWYNYLDLQVRRKMNLPVWQPLRFKNLMDIATVKGKHNVVTSVPKDSSKRRTIAKEQPYSMYFQLGIHNWLSERLKRFGLDITSNRRNRYRAWVGSQGDGTFSPVTIDLSDASDRIRVDQIERYFSADWFKLLMSLRAEYSTLLNKSIRLNKYGSQGNGTTFVVETILFAAIAAAAYEDWNGAPFYLKDHITVFGDDIIVPQVVGPRVLDALVRHHYVPNVDKSFLYGPVRESCGGDYYHGCDVRPIYLRRIPDNLGDAIALRNRIYLWWAKVVSTSFPKSIDEFFRQYCRNVPDVPVNDDMSSGFFSRVWDSRRDGSTFHGIKARMEPIPLVKEKGFVEKHLFEVRWFAYKQPDDRPIPWLDDCMRNHVSDVSSYTKGQKLRGYHSAATVWKVPQIEEPTDSWRPFNSTS